MRCRSHILAVVMPLTLAALPAPSPTVHPYQKSNVGREVLAQVDVPQPHSGRTGTDDDSVRPFGGITGGTTPLPNVQVLRPKPPDVLGKQRIGTDDDSVRPMRHKPGQPR